MNLPLLALLGLALAAVPPLTSRVTDDEGCEKGLDADNELDGELVCLYPDGSKRLEAMYSHGKKVGVLRSWRSSGKLERMERYVGGRREGMSAEYDADGNLKSSCEYKADRRHGLCREYARDGSLREERTWFEGEQQGETVRVDSRGASVRVREALDVGGKRNGDEVRFFPDGGTESSRPFVAGKREGLEREWSSNGRLKHETQWKADRRDGVDRDFFESGVLRREAQWKAGEQDGLVREFHENGQLKQQTCMKAGRRVVGLAPCTGARGPEVLTRFFPDGKPEEEEGVLDGKRHGDFKRYRAGGGLAEESHWVAGARDGVQRQYAESGALQRSTTWKAGRRDGPDAELLGDGGIAEQALWADDRKLSVTSWWMNGKKKREEAAEGAGTVVRTWHDTGKQATELHLKGPAARPINHGVERKWTEAGVLTADYLWVDGKPDGVERDFDPKTGRLVEEETWVKGVRTGRRTFDKDTGAQLTSEEFYPDGSRK